MPFKYAAFTAMMREYTPEEAVDTLSRHGYDGIEWRTMNIPTGGPLANSAWNANKATLNLSTLIKDSKEIKKMCDEKGLEIRGLGSYLSYKLADDLKQCMESAKIMDCPSVRIAAPTYDGTADYNDVYEQSVDGFSIVADLASEYKVRASIELRPGTICPSPSLAYRLVSNFDPTHIGVILDPANMIAEGLENWQMGIELLGPYLSYIHVKNMQWVKEESPSGPARWNTKTVPVKEGVVHWPDVLDALANVGYMGWISFEDFSEVPTELKLSDNLEYFKAIENDLIA